MTPKKVRYETPLNHVPGFDDLKRLSSLKEFESTVVGVKENGEKKMRVITGGEYDIDTYTMHPSIDVQVANLKSKGVLSSAELNRQAADQATRYPTY